MDLALNNLQRLICYTNQTTNLRNRSFMVRIWRKVDSKLSKAGLNSEFSFF